jgi:serine/arginine repetitive matrix protein 2
VDFVFDSEDTNPQQVLLPPIGLQPPSPLRTIAQLAVESTLAEMPSQKERSRSQQVLGGRIISFGFIGVRHAPGTLSPVFSAIPSSPSSVSTLARPRTLQPTSPSISSSSLFFAPTGSPFLPASPNKLAGHSPGKQSVSLGRATAVGGWGGGGGANGIGSGSGSVPRRNSLGDLKIPARISQAQVGPQRDLGMVREFAMNIERQFFFSLSFGFVGCLLT